MSTPGRWSVWSRCVAKPSAVNSTTQLSEPGTVAATRPALAHRAALDRALKQRHERLDEPRRGSAQALAAETDPG